MPKIVNWPIVIAGIALLVGGLAIFFYGVSLAFGTVVTFSYGTASFSATSTQVFYSWLTAAIGGIIAVVGGGLLYLGFLYYPARSFLASVTEVSSSVSSEYQQRPAGNALFCPRCGAPVATGMGPQEYCKNCGTRLV